MISALTILRPGNGRSSNSAPNLPRTRPRPCDPKVKRKVLPSVRRKTGFSHDLREIRQSHEAPRGIVDRVGADRIIHRPAKRQSNQQQHIKDRRRDEDRAEHVAAVQDEPETRGRLGGDGFGNVTIDENLAFSGGLVRLPSLVEMAQRAVAHGVGMPLSRPDAFLGDMGRRQFRGDHLCLASEPSIAP